MFIINKKTYGVGFALLWVKLFFIRFKAKQDAKKPEKVIHRLFSVYEETLSKLALMAKTFVEKNESLLMSGVVPELKPEEVPQLDEKSDESIVKQKSNIADIKARNQQKIEARKKAEERIKELEVKKVELQNAFQAIFEKAHGMADVYLARVAPILADNFKNPFDVVPNISDFISLVKGESEDEMVQEENS